MFRRLSIRSVMLLGILLAAFAVPSSALAGQGNNNRGDVWTDTVGQQPGPGHEQDVHLPCSDINVWANGMANSGGQYAVYGWPPSGSQEQVYSSSWSYNQVQGGDQVISVIPVKTLIANAVANGDTPQNQQGYHFKLQVSQNPVKYKTFWVECAPPSTPPAPCGTQGGQPCPTPPPCNTSCTPTPPGPPSTPPGPPSPPPVGQPSPPPQTVVVVTPPPTVVVVTTPPTVVVLPCPCTTHKPGKSHRRPKSRCPRVNKRQYRLWFNPTRPLSIGVVTFHATAPKSAHVKKVVITIRGRENAHKRTLVFRRSPVIKPINVANPFYWGVTHLHGVDVGTWGHYQVTAAFFLKCGRKVVVRVVILNNDPPKGVKVP